MLTDGFISLHRSLLNWEWYDNINTKTLFIHLLLTVNWYDEKWRGIEIKRGQRLTSVAKLSSETSLSIQNVRTALANLELTNEITIKASTRNSIITVLQYDFYQTVTNKIASEVTDSQQRANKELTKSQQLINNTNKANKTNKANTLCKNEQTTQSKNEEILTEYVFPCRDGSEYILTKELYNIFRSTYRELSLDALLRSMVTWTAVNPTKRKTQKGMSKFIDGWLKREQSKNSEAKAGLPLEEFYVPPKEEIKRGPKPIVGYINKEGVFVQDEVL